MADNSVYVPWKEWTVVKRLGSGSYGEVYEIHRFIGNQEEKAAMKVITIPKSQEDIELNQGYGYSRESIEKRYDTDREKVLKEYQVMMSMKGHSNIVSCEDIESERIREGIGWHIYIRMEYLTPLLQYRRLHNLNENDIRRLGIDICRALVLCEQKNIVHRDIKPENILVSDFGSFKLGDFGIARTMEHSTMATPIGTMPYMAPEIVRGGYYGQTVDIYSLGMVLYQFLNNFRMPFEPQGTEPPDAEVRMQAYYRRINGDPLPLPENGSYGLKLIVRKACEYDPKKRYDSAQQMLDALERLQGTGGNSGQYRNGQSKTSDNSYAKKVDKKGKISKTAAVIIPKTESVKNKQNERKKSEKKSGKHKILRFIWRALVVIGILAVIGIIIIMISPGVDTSVIGPVEDVFPDENFRSILLQDDSSIDENNDGYVSVDECNAIAKLYISDSDIDDLSGIEYLTSLQVLDCSKNNLKSLDVTANSELTELSCWDNNLDELDISENPKLVYLYCDLNNLVTLDTMNNPDLKELECSSNLLRSLYITNSTKLTELICYDNQLSAIDLRNNTELTSLNCAHNSIKKLDLTNNPDLDSDNVTVDDDVSVTYY